jgi:hypothetical protein
LFNLYSKTFEDIPAASEIWKKAAIYEENHKRQFELVACLIRSYEFDVSKDCLDRARIIHLDLLKSYNYIKNSEPDLLTALSKAIDLEEKLAGLHAHTAHNFRDESMQELFTTLERTARDNISIFRQYRNQLAGPEATGSCSFAALAVVSH